MPERHDELERPEVISYERLYRLWEHNNWSATDIDFTLDKEHWYTKLDDLQRRSALWNYAMFLVGEEAVARTLTPMLDAAPGHPESIFLTTQIVDEARHHVFFDRFMREVVGIGRDPSSTLEEVRSELTWGFNQVFAELDRLSEGLRKKPKDRPLLAQMVALYHVVIEGVLAIPGQHFIQRYVERFEILPGFREGITNVSRDESRHVAFGIKFLGELVRGSDECRAAALELWDRVMPWAAGVFIPPSRDRAYVECFDFDLNEIFAFGLRSFETKLKRIGFDIAELRLFAGQDLEQPYDERARRTWVLIDCGVIGDDRREPELTEEAFELLFDGMARTIDIDVARSLGGPIEWRFTDAEPWHLVVTNGHVEAKPGRGGEPALTLESSSAEWAKIAVNRTDPRMSLLRRKLKVHGSLGARAKLPKLFR
ncbi:MAG: ribonucleotide-diphosphate reductase subunit beta [Actinomycetota bacterium]|nr:ribonucleotide-diphosphate reductase subunit beta [Actinomycetota bacterium]